LTKWLADRGRRLRGVRISSEQESGVGSGILSRFQVRPPSSKIAPTPPSSETISNRAANVDTTRLNDSSGVDLGDDEITLAPLDDDPREEKKSSDVLAADSGRLRPSPAASGPPSMSLFEEEVLEAVAEPVIRRHSGEFDYNPLHPPGFTSPYKKSVLPWVLAAGAAIVVLIVIVVIAMQ
jgi:hypothetical protein